MRRTPRFSPRTPSTTSRVPSVSPWMPLRPMKTTTASPVPSVSFRAAPMPRSSASGGDPGGLGLLDLVPELGLARLRHVDHDPEHDNGDRYDRSADRDVVLV